MLSPIHGRDNAVRCVYCAFRTRQLALQCQRQRVTTTAFSGTTHIRYHDVNQRGNRSRERGRDKQTARQSSAKLSEYGSGYFNKTRDPQSGGFRYRFKRDSEDDYNDVLNARLTKLKTQLKDAPVLEQVRKESKEEGNKVGSYNKIWNGFLRKVHGDFEQRIPWLGSPDEDGNGGNSGVEKGESLKTELRDAYRTSGALGLENRLTYAFYGHVIGSRFTESDIKNQKALADLRYPTEWFPATRIGQRKIHLHVGPTNSGKTYHALQRLEQAKTGVYAGPLRLLAHEVYNRMNAKGKSCALVTGEERRIAQAATEESNGDESQSKGSSRFDLVSCTVEMMPLNKPLDVAVIDEIQMIGNRERGWAWTQALLGVRAAEVHLCGEERTVPLIRSICASVGEELEIHRYQRLSPLQMADESLNGDLTRLRKGDCIVSFSVMGIHALRRQIEHQTGKKVATVYGSLPPETRAQQARLFNDPNNDYDYLVASDAVGMGLNLAIKRIIFEASSKFDGLRRKTLSIADIKQIAGRAGRYRVASEQVAEAANAAATKQGEPDVMAASMEEEKLERLEDLAAAKGDSPPTEAQNQAKPSFGNTEKENIGLVTTLEKFDFPIVSAAMTSEPEPIYTAGLFPPAAVLERFASYFPPGTPFSYILMRLHELSQTNASRFHLCGLKDQLWIADLIEPVQGLTIADRNIICSAPCSQTDEEMWRALLPAYARCVAAQSGGDIVDIEELPLEVLEAENVVPTRDYLRELERLHKGIVTYLWLSYRFAGIFHTRQLAFHVKEMVEERIEAVLSKVSFSETKRRQVVEMRRQILEQEVAALAAAEGQKGSGGKEEAGPDHSAALERQTSVTSGGDRFGGEEDIAFEEHPAAGTELAAEEEAGVHGSVKKNDGESSTGSFAEWRKQQTRGESQASKEWDVDTTLSSTERGVGSGEEDGLDLASDSPSATSRTERFSPSAPSSSQDEDEKQGQKASSLDANEDLTPLQYKETPPLVQRSPPQDHHQPFSAGILPTKNLSRHIEVNTEAKPVVDSRP